MHKFQFFLWNIILTFFRNCHKIVKTKLAGRHRSYMADPALAFSAPNSEKWTHRYLIVSGVTPGFAGDSQNLTFPGM